MIYLDSNIFIIATLYSDEKGERARGILRDIRDGKKKAATSVLTFDEVFWEVRKHRGKDAALEAAEAMLSMPYLNFLPVDAAVLWKTLEIIKKYNLHPRDAIHLACAALHGISAILSEDTDFDKIKEVKRKSLFE
ncbi:MAG: type II toxin-antitoxin system VapC family toxin [Candidatus Hydrothermarchaeota archaeon]|nr:type II toxin-antitoxin system VapC family toxin [Candidatus Hydrothermarchaeota archaeon]